MRILVIGASGGTGLAATHALAAAGHEVSAFARRPPSAAGVRGITGDALREDDVDRAVAGHDAVVVALGIRESALAVRLRGAAGTADDVRSRGTRHVVDAMRRHGVRKLVALTSYGTGPTRPLLTWPFRLMFALLLAPQIADTERQDETVRASGLDWVIVQPVNLTDAAVDAEPHVSSSGEIRRAMVSRRQVGRFLALAATTARHDGQTVALSGA